MEHRSDFRTDVTQSVSGGFDKAESLSEALGLLLEFETPIRLNTYKMQYFPHYPFTDMTLAAGHISEEDVTDEKLAESVLYNMVYRPKFPAFERRDYLENCICLVPWTGPMVRAALGRLQRGHDPLVGMVVSVLAQFRYWQSFQQVRPLVWARRLYLGLGLLPRGDFATLRRRISDVWKKRHNQQPNTGRLSMR